MDIMPVSYRFRLKSARVAVVVACLLLIGSAGSPTSAIARPSPVQTGDGEAARDVARAWRQAHESAIVEELLEFLAIPNVATDAPNIHRNARWIVDAFARRGVEMEIVATPGAPWVYGELTTPGATSTLLFYAHYDGQPADPARWIGHTPWEPVFRNGSLDDGAAIVPTPAAPIPPDWRIYARSASDDRSPIVMMLTALDALRDAGISPRANIKFLFEGEEEAGSPNANDFVRQHAERLRADAMLLADGPKHPSGKPTLVFGVRGITTVQITVYGPARPLHSGHYGNWAPNSAMRLAHLLATMKDPDTGDVLVSGWNDDRVPLSPAERSALGAVPDDPAQSPAALGFGEPEGPWDRRVEAIIYNSLNVRGLSSGWVGEARTIVPDQAIAEIDLRLVVDTRPDTQISRLIDHIRAQGFHVIDEDPNAETRAQYARLAKVTKTEFGYPPTRVAMDLPIAQRLIARAERAFGTEAVAIPTSGGSLPLYAFEEGLGIPTIGVPTVNHDNNQHSPNENVRIGNLWDGIEMLAVMLTAQQRYRRGSRAREPDRLPRR